jgi:hypothetical protein
MRVESEADGELDVLVRGPATLRASTTPGLNHKLSQTCCGRGWVLSYPRPGTTMPPEGRLWAL